MCRPRPFIDLLTENRAMAGREEEREAGEEGEGQTGMASAGEGELCQQAGAELPL